MKGDKIIYREWSYQVMQAVFEVHNTLGPGFAESVYKDSCHSSIRGIRDEA